jgi:hypothetical protein
MSGIKGWLLGGSDESGWEDLVRRVTEAIASVGHFGARGRPAFPPEVEVEIVVSDNSLDVIRCFVEKAKFDQQVQAGLANRCDCAVHVLPLRSYRVAAGKKTEIKVSARTGERSWQITIQGGDFDGRAWALPSGRSLLRFGRGEWHGGDQQLRNDLVVCETTEFVSRRAGRLLRTGAVFEVESLDQRDYLIVRRPDGETVRPSRTGSARLALRDGDEIELTDGKGNSVRLLLKSQLT